MDFATILQVLDSTVRLATPLLLACLAGLFSERSGVIDIGLEGKMLIAAFASAAFAYYFSQNPVAGIGPIWMGLLMGVLASLAFSGLHGLASITFRGNQLISGVALNFLASGLSVLVAQSWFHEGGRTPSLPNEGRFDGIVLPGALGPADAEAAGRPLSELIAQANPIQQIYSELISGHSILVYVAFLMVPATWWVLFRTRFGLRLRAVGEAPEAVDTAGVSVTALRYGALVIAGVLCGLAGAYLATGLQAGFVREMTAGRGYIALAALIFAKWRPWYALMACLLFGFLQAIALRYQNIDLGAFTVPVQFMDALPYILTVVILAGFVGKAIPPRAGGDPYVKER